ncbi:putative tyrosine-protein kinase ephrin type A/B receptor [Senna tora]|uniref:Putative tyrosine-protein kinase ephrin type A/B receptor n=1 Tax=Senna tora TaxID=362788 RepID=A0A834W983_9FABA|nr:putative tyrosine-protein kinase ephrin type A/B receptor [Senna tora]
MGASATNSYGAIAVDALYVMNRSTGSKNWLSHSESLSLSVNSSSLGGPPPSQTSGTPFGYDGAGGGHAGRGASCLENNNTKWGGHVYAWFTLSEPWSYRSKGGGKSSQKKYGGSGGGRVKLLVKDTLYLDGSVTAEGGDRGSEGGGFACVGLNCAVEYMESYLCTEVVNFYVVQ